MNLQAFFAEHPNAAIALSGGVDSSYLLYAGLKYGKKIHAYYVRSQFQPAFEYRNALGLAEQLSAALTVIDLDVLRVPGVCENPNNRCYICKQAIFSAILDAAAKDGFDLVLDGTNASDDADDRPGMRALRELGVLSPLRICGLTKDEIRASAREAGLPVWNKPAYACLATRVPHGEEITAQKLEAVEAAEQFLFGLGFTDFRVRSVNGTAKLQLRAEQLPLLLEKRAEIVARFKSMFSAVLLDLEVRT